MQISRRGDYSIRAVVDVAGNPPNTMVLTREIALRQAIPQVFLTKIISRLAQAGLLRAYRGATGGVTLAKPAAEISLKDVIEAVEGPIALNLCLIRPGECPNDKTCGVHLIWKQAQEQMVKLFEETTIDKLVEKNAQLSAANNEPRVFVPVKGRQR